MHVSSAVHGYARSLVGKWELVLGYCAQPMSMLGHRRYLAWRWMLGRRPELGESAMHGFGYTRSSTLELLIIFLLMLGHVSSAMHGARPPGELDQAWAAAAAFCLVPEHSYRVSSGMRSVPSLSRRWPEHGGVRELEVCGEPSLKLNFGGDLISLPPWEPRVPIHPSLLEMTPLRISSPAPDSPEYSSQGSEESSFSGDESCPAREFGEDNALCVSAASLEGRSPKKLRIKLKSRSLGESSQSRPETTALCVVDAADTPGPLPSRGRLCPQCLLIMRAL
ncbi:hypothetical protein Dimus_007601 [Dionaea muscipula]